MSLGDSVPRRRGADTTAGSSIILSCRNISITIPSVDSVADVISSPPNTNPVFCLTRRRAKPVFPNFIPSPFPCRFWRDPHDFLTRLRMDRAKQMLASEPGVTEVCFEVGTDEVVVPGLIIFGVLFFVGSVGSQGMVLEN
jgi:hypothetical protein